VYDTQGIRDDGVDAVVRIPSADSGEPPKLIGFQVKSFDDMAKPGHLQDLKSQHSDAIRKVHGLEYYFIMLCTDIQRHRDRVRNVTPEFRSDGKVEIVEPQFAYTFLHHPATRIEAIVKRMVESSDAVFRDALTEVFAFDSPSARALVIYLTVESVLSGRGEFLQEDLASDRILEDVYSELREKQADQLEETAAKKEAALGRAEEEEENSEDDEDEEDFDDDEEGPVQIGEFRAQLAGDLDLIETSVVRQDSNSGSFHFHASQLRALTAVTADAIARFEYSRSELMNYAFDAMGIRD
jgi:hypothetical protein